MFQLGGHAIYLAPWDIRLGERETVADVARNLARVVDMIVARTFRHAVLVELAAQAKVPVINGLTDLHHPCQVARRPLHAGRAPPEARRAADRVHRRRQQPRALVDGGGDALPVHVRRRLPDRATSRTPSSSPSATKRGARIEVTTSVADAVGAPTSSTPTSGRAWGRRKRPPSGATRFAELSDQRRRAAPCRQGRARDALPAGAPRRGDHRRRASRAASRSSSTRPRTACISRRR